MGDMAEMAMEGILCETCGVLLDSEAPGPPRRCDDCPPTEVAPEAHKVIDLMAALKASLARAPGDGSE